jgi:hypothetical protein
MPKKSFGMSAKEYFSQHDQSDQDTLSAFGLMRSLPDPPWAFRSLEKFWMNGTSILPKVWFAYCIGIRPRRLLMLADACVQEIVRHDGGPKLVKAASRWLADDSRDDEKQVERLCGETLTNTSAAFRPSTTSTVGPGCHRLAAVAFGRSVIAYRKDDWFPTGLLCCLRHAECINRSRCVDILREATLTDYGDDGFLQPISCRDIAKAWQDPDSSQISSEGYYPVITPHPQWRYM